MLIFQIIALSMEPFLTFFGVGLHYGEEWTV